MRTAYILRGPPACGKSTFARDLLKREPNRWKRINKDDLRAMLDSSVWSRENEELVQRLEKSIISSAFKSGYDVILDNTNLSALGVKKLHTFLSSIGDVKVIEKCFTTPSDECIRRNALRTGVARVPDDAMKRMLDTNKSLSLKDKETYYPPRFQSEAYVVDASLPDAILCDLDGTLAIMGDRSPYDASRCDELDTPNLPVVECVKAMYSQGAKIIFFSAREDKDRAPTVRFINKWVRFAPTQFDDKGNLWDGNEPVIDYELFMRPTGDNRNDAIMKEIMFNEHINGTYNVRFILDDRNRVVEKWREMGLTCFQVAEGDF